MMNKPCSKKLKK